MSTINKPADEMMQKVQLEAMGISLGVALASPRCYD